MIQKPQANLNARFFKLEYLTDKLRFEVEFLDVTRGPQSYKYWLVASSGYGQIYFDMPKVMINSRQLYFKNELSYEVSFSQMVRNQQK